MGPRATCKKCRVRPAPRSHPSRNTLPQTGRPCKLCTATKARPASEDSWLCETKKPPRFRQRDKGHTRDVAQLDHSQWRNERDCTCGFSIETKKPCHTCTAKLLKKNEQKRKRAARLEKERQAQADHGQLSITTPISHGKRQQPHHLATPTSPERLGPRHTLVYTPTLEGQPTVLPWKFHGRFFESV